MSNISIQVNQSTTAQIPAGDPRVSTLVDVVDAAGADQKFSLDGTESPVGFIPSVSVAAGAGVITISDIDAAGAVIGSPVTVPYTTVAAAPQFASVGATVVVNTP